MIDQEIQARMDAFRGNPQALMQRYAQNQQLVDLLALQKLKSEKEAAARQIQMQMGQGQMPTVAQQREQELMGMAKQEVAQRVGAVGQQQAQQQQQNLQRAAQTGIAQAPAPNMMPTQAMASGGIVAFAGPEGSYVEGEDEPRLPGESDEAYLERVGGSPFTRGLKRLGKSAMDVLTAPSPIQNEEYARLRDLERNVLPQYSRGMFARMTPEQARTEQLVQNFYKQNKEQIVREPGLYEAFKRDPVGVASGRASTQREAVGQIAAPTDTSYAAAEAARARARQQMVGQMPAAPAAQTPPAAAQPVGAFQGDPQQIMAQIAAIQDPNERAAAMAAFQRQQAAGPIPPAPQSQGIAQAVPPTAGAQPPAPAQPGGLQAAYEQAGIGALTGKPEAAGMSAEEAYAKRFDPLFQQQLALKQQGLAEAQRLAERERAMRDPLTAYLLGARGRTIGEVLGSAGRAGMEYQQQGLTRDQALAKQLQDLQEAQLGAQITQEKEKYGVGEARRKEAVGEREKAMTSAGTYLTGMASADARRDIADLQSQVRQAAAKTQDMEQRARMAEAAYKGDPEVENIQNELKTVDVKINPEKAAQLKARMRAIQIEKYRLFSVEVPPELAAAAAGAAPSNIPAPPPGAVRPKGVK